VFKKKEERKGWGGNVVFEDEKMNFQKIKAKKNGWVGSRKKGHWGEGDQREKKGVMMSDNVQCGRDHGVPGAKRKKAGEWGLLLTGTAKKGGAYRKKNRKIFEKVGEQR